MTEVEPQLDSDGNEIPLTPDEYASVVRAG